MILITGATGHVGSQVVAALLPAHAGQIRVLTRNPDAVFPDGTQKVVADLANSEPGTRTGRRARDVSCSPTGSTSPTTITGSWPPRG